MLNAAAAPSDCGRIKLADFGLARDVGQESLTRSGGLVGTPHYMSPEQAQVRASSLDQRTDVYSLGVVLYELLTLTRPFDGETDREVLSKICEQRPAPIRRLDKRVPADLATVCETAMAYEPGDRYATAAAFSADLRRFMSFESIKARRPTVWQLAKRVVRRHQRICAFLTAMVAAFAIGVWWVAGAVKAGEVRDQLVPVRAAEGAPDLAAWPLEDLVVVRDRLGVSRWASLGRGAGLGGSCSATAPAGIAKLARRSASGAGAPARGRSRIRLTRSRGFGHFEAAVRRLTQVHALFPGEAKGAPQSVFQPRVSLSVLDGAGSTLSGPCSLCAVRG